MCFLVYYSPKRMFRRLIARNIMSAITGRPLSFEMHASTLFINVYNVKCTQVSKNNCYRRTVIVFVYFDRRLITNISLIVLVLIWPDFIPIGDSGQRLGDFGFAPANNLNLSVYNIV